MRLTSVFIYANLLQESSRSIPDGNCSDTNQNYSWDEVTAVILICYEDEEFIRATQYDDVK